MKPAWIIALAIWQLAIISPADAAECGSNGQSLTTVSEVYPTSDVLPANLLRIYLYFSGPMRSDGNLDAISLQDEQGNPVDGVFFKSRFELWSEDRRRLTLLLDPGRVKTGLNAHEELGRALGEGQEFSLVIGQDMIDSNGCTMAGEFVKTFTVGPEDKGIPDIDAWVMDVPRSSAREPLSVQLDGSYDHISLAYRLRVVDEGGRSLPGAIDVGADESLWHFTPRADWAPGRYKLIIDPRLEDLAGNRPTGLFDDPTGQSRINQSIAKPYEIEFSPVE
ncbi:MAG: hypothetical protein AAFY84_11200 [Pseudomonadota bacterium]